MESIIKEGTEPANFGIAGDFGPAFYCADNVGLTMMFATINSADIKGALISSDAKQDGFAALV